ncbi:hypothetical protein ACLOJK_027741 [Asimina triloba]
MSGKIQRTSLVGKSNKAPGTICYGLAVIAVINMSSAEYMTGFLISLGPVVLLRFTLPYIELAYAKANRAITYAAIAREAREYGLGEATYYLVLIGSAIVFEMVFVGALGIIFCDSSLFTDVLSTALRPITVIVKVIAFKEKFTGEKGLALVLSLWGFTSYFYGSYKTQKTMMG